MRWASRRGSALLFISLALVSWNWPQPAAAASPPTVDAKILAAAKEWFHRFQTGNIDRSQLNAEVNQQVTAEGVQKEEATLKAFGEPLRFRFLGSGPLRGAMACYFAIDFHMGTVLEAIAYDVHGKIAGIDFQTYVPDTPNSTT